MVRFFLLARVPVLCATLAGCSLTAHSPLPPPDAAALRSSLRVAGAALAASQTGVASRLYRDLAVRYPAAPEPWLGLAAIECANGEWVPCERASLEGASHASHDPDLCADAFLGATRAALSDGRPSDARAHLRPAVACGAVKRDVVAALHNADGVLATLSGDEPSARTAFDAALARHPNSVGIRANYHRALIAFGYPVEAQRRFPDSVASPPTSSARSVVGSFPLSISQHLALSRLLILRLGPSCLPARQVRCAVAPAPGPGESVLPAFASQRVHHPLVALSYSSPSDLMSSASRPPTAAPVRSIDLTVGESIRLVLPAAAAGVVVTSPSVADVRLLSPDAVFAVGRSPGLTSVVVLPEGSGPELVWSVHVRLDLAPFREILASDPVFSALRVSAVAGAVALSGSAASTADLDRALALLTSILPDDVAISTSVDTPAPRQVNLEVQIAEVRRSVTEDLGISWESFSRQGGPRDYGFRIGRTIVPVPEDPLGTPPAHPLLGVLPRLFSTGPASQVLFSLSGDDGSFRAMVEALATAGLANVLARPNVTAISGQSASFFSGGEFPLPSGFEDGVIIYEYRRVGVLLDFVPTVIDSNRIVLTVRPEVSEPSADQGFTIQPGIDVPVINVRRAETTVEVADGESVVIAGLFRTHSTQTESGLPVAKDLPVLGSLFGSTSVHSSDLELLVVVTPRLVALSRESSTATGASPPSLQGYAL